MKKDDKITVIKEYVSNQTVNAFMKHGVEKYFHEYIIVIDDDWYTPCEFISEFGLEDSFGPEYVFEQVVIAVKSSIKWLKKQGFKPDEDSDDESYNLYMMIDFIKNIKDSNQLNEKRIELSNPYPVKKDEIIDLIERSSRLIHTVTDSKTIQIYIYSKGNDRPEALAEVEITSVGYILHGAEGYDYQGNSFKEFNNDLNDVVFHFDYTTSKRFGESYNKSQLFDRVLNESSLKESECSLEWLLDKAYVSEYRMVSKNSAEVRVRHTPVLLTSESMAARFAEDIPDGYRLEVDFLGEDPILGRNFDIYEVQLLKE